MRFPAALSKLRPRTSTKREIDPRSLRLHLGCGESYLEGYVNIDFPPSEHTVQTRSRADQNADITTLSYPPGSAAEIRLHHVFEHFDRPTALRLLVDWRLWLVPGGLLTIETPDFERCAREFGRRMRWSRRGVLLRHIFGSHEAAWAVHFDGWYEDRYRRTLGALAYRDLKFERGSWKGTHNITVTARADSSHVDRGRLLRLAEELLRESLVDNSQQELRLHAHWLNALHSERQPTSRA
jgi:predicted SAM-dependent methyltransferase